MCASRMLHLDATGTPRFSSLLPLSSCFFLVVVSLRITLVEVLRRIWRVRWQAKQLLVRALVERHDFKPLFE